MHSFGTGGLDTATDKLLRCCSLPQLNTLGVTPFPSWTLRVTPFSSWTLWGSPRSPAEHSEGHPFPQLNTLGVTPFPSWTLWRSPRSPAKHPEGHPVPQLNTGGHLVPQLNTRGAIHYTCTLTNAFHRVMAQWVVNNEIEMKSIFWISFYFPL